MVGREPWSVDSSREMILARQLEQVCSVVEVASGNICAWSFAGSPDRVLLHAHSSKGACIEGCCTMTIVYFWNEH